MLLLSLVTSNSGLAGDVFNPDWQRLEFQQKALWVTAKSTLSVTRCSEADAPAQWCVTAISSVAENTETITAEVTANGTLRKRERASVGRKQRRIKRWEYGADGITRTRLEPDRSGSYAPSSVRELAYPDKAGSVTDPLLLLLATPSNDPAFRREFLVHTDLNFYTVVATVAGTETLQVNIELDGEPLNGEREVILVQLQAHPVEPLNDKPDFNLRGLSGNITVVYDAETGVPLQLRGKAPRLGETRLNLVAATRTGTPSQ